MTRWSFRRRRAETRDAEREYRPAAPVAGRPPTAQPATDQPQAYRPGSPAQGSGWFDPGWGRPGQPGSGPYRTGESGTGPYDPDQYGAGQPGASQYGPGPHGSGGYPAGPPLAGQPGAGQYGTSLLSGGQAVNGTAVLSTAQPPAPGHQAPLSQPLPQPGMQPVQPESAAALDWTGHPDMTDQRPASVWPDICDQFGLHLLVLAEQLRTSLDELEAEEGDPERLRRLYQVDHAVTRMRRATRDLRTLAGRSEEELAGFTTSLLDVIRMAISAIERYTQVTIGRVTDLAVLGYAADDIGSMMAALLDNATRYSPGNVTVSGHLLDDGSVMFRIEDTGIGMGAEQVNALNAAFAGPVIEVDERTGRHTGFPVVHRIARKHSVGVRLATRPLPRSGTVAMVTLPPHLLCEVPPEDAQRRPAPAHGTPVTTTRTGQPAPTPPRPIVVPDLPRGEPTRAQQVQQWEPPELSDRGEQRPASDLPRREPASLRGDELRPRQQEPALAKSPEEQAAARRAFADDLSAFSQGTVDSPVFAGDTDDADDTDDTATEEGAKP
jgi:hypothetical protein